jgi:hypothetical protein
MKVADADPRPPLPRAPEKMVHEISLKRSKNMAKKINARIAQKHDIPANWDKAANFIPDQGEIIVYDDRYKDESGEWHIVADFIKYKIGDGQRTVGELPFVSLEHVKSLENGVQIDGSLIFNDGIANGDYSIVGGTSDKTVISNIIGELAGTSIVVNAPSSNASSSISLGSGTEVRSTGGNAIGVMNVAGVKGFYWESVSKTADNKY